MRGFGVYIKTIKVKITKICSIKFADFAKRSVLNLIQLFVLLIFLASVCVTPARWPQTASAEARDQSYKTFFVVNVSAVVPILRLNFDVIFLAATYLYTGSFRT